MSRTQRRRDGKRKRKKKEKSKAGGWEVWDTTQKDERQLDRERKREDRARNRKHQAELNRGQSKPSFRKKKKSKQEKLEDYIAWNRRQTSGFSAKQLSTHIEIIVTDHIILTEVDLAIDVEKLSRIKRKQHLNNLDTLLSKLPEQ